MTTATTTACIRSAPTRQPAEPAEPNGSSQDDLLELARRPWTMRIGRRPMLVRPSSVRDLAAVAQMHRRCSARSLLDRYRCGGRPPVVAALDRSLRNPYSVVVLTGTNEVVAVGSVQRDPTHNPRCATAELLVEDELQRHGIGTEVMTHLAGVAQAAGFHELIAYPATALPAAQRLMLDVGRTRMVPDVDAHLHTYLPDGATLGLGSVRQRLAG